MTDRAQAVPFGDSGVLIRLGLGPGPATARRVHRLAAAVRQATGGEAGWGKPIPAAASVLVPVDPLEPGVEVALTRVRALLAGLAAPLDDNPAPGPRIEIPTRYGGAAGPDLAPVAAALGLTEAAVVDLHASVDYEVLFVGFAPGFAYLGELPEAIATPRLATPRTRVPAGSVAIAGRLTAVYPFESPGGWQLLGHTDTGLWDVERKPPALLVPGVRVRFVPV